MKRIVSMLITISLISVGCSFSQTNNAALSFAINSNTYSSIETKNNTPSPTKEFNMEFKQLSNFYESINDGTLNRFFRSKGIKYYWVPTILPFGSHLEYIHVSDVFVTYYYDLDISGDINPFGSYQLHWTWYFGDIYNNTDEHIKSLKRRGYKELHIKNDAHVATYLGTEEYPEDLGNQNPADIWTCYYTQDGGCFDVNFPKILDVGMVNQLLIMEKKNID